MPDKLLLVAQADQMQSNPYKTFTNWRSLAVNIPGIAKPATQFYTYTCWTTRDTQATRSLTSERLTAYQNPYALFVSAAGHTFIATV